MAFSCASGDSKSLCICTRRDICVSYTRGACELSYMYAVHIYGRMCLLVYPVNLCVHMCDACACLFRTIQYMQIEKWVKRMFWFTCTPCFSSCGMYTHGCMYYMSISTHKVVVQVVLFAFVSFLCWFMVCSYFCLVDCEIFFGHSSTWWFLVGLVCWVCCWHVVIPFASDK